MAVNSRERRSNENDDVGVVSQAAQAILEFLASDQDQQFSAEALAEKVSFEPSIVAYALLNLNRRAAIKQVVSSSKRESVTVQYQHKPLTYREKVYQSPT